MFSVCLKCREHVLWSPSRCVKSVENMCCVLSVCLKCREPVLCSLSVFKCTVFSLCV